MVLTIQQGGTPHHQEAFMSSEEEELRAKFTYARDRVLADEICLEALLEQQRHDALLERNRKVQARVAAYKDRGRERDQELER